MIDSTLLIILFAPFAGATTLLFVSNKQALLVRVIAAAAAGMSLLTSCYMFFAYDPVECGFQFLKRFECSKELGIASYLGVYGIGAPQVLATATLLFAWIF